MSSDTRVTACIPHFRCRKYVRRAVQSLLEQSHRNIEVFVMNDGDPQPPWDVLADIRDPRLIRFNLQTNRGPYFATEVVLSSTSTPYFLIQDADDWSSPGRVERLLDALQREHSDLAVSATPQFVECTGGNRIAGVRWQTASHLGDAGNHIVHHRITPNYKYRAPHHGLYRSACLRAVGGYYCGLRISFDALVTNLVLMIGSISHVPEPLYFRLLRPESLTHDSGTGVGSESAKREWTIQRHLYRSCFYYYQFFKAGRITLTQLTACIRAVCGSNVTPADRHDLMIERNRLSSLLQQYRRDRWAVRQSERSKLPIPHEM